MEIIPIFIFTYLFIAAIECPNPKSALGGKNAPENFTAFGMKQSEIAQQYANLFIHKISDDHIQWQIGAFLLDRMLHQIEQQSISSIQSLSAASSSSGARGRRKEEAKKKKGRSGQSTGGKERKEGEEEGGEEAKLLERRKIEEFAQKLSQFKKEAKNIKIGAKNAIFGFEELLGLFKNLFFNNFFVENIMEKFGEKIKLEWNPKEEIEMSQSEAEKMEKIGKDLRLILRTLHREELTALLAGTNKENKLYKGMQELGEEKNKGGGNAEEIGGSKKWESLELAKEKMRAMVGADWVFINLEMAAPILLRIDIIESTELVRLYKKMLLSSAALNQKNPSLTQITIATIFGKIWALKGQKVGIRERLMKLWKEKKSVGGPNDNAMLGLWMEILGSSERKQLLEEIRKTEKAKMLKIFKKFAEFGEFLDKNEGSRGRMVKILNCENQIGKIFVEEKEKEFAAMLRIDKNKEQMSEEFLKNYLKVFTLRDGDVEKKKAMLKIFILLGVEFMDRQFATMPIEWEEANLEEKWTTQYRPMFFFFLDQIANSEKDWEFCEEYGTPFRNMLYIWQKLDRNLDEELKRELNNLKGINGKPTLIDLDEQLEMLRMANQILPELVEKYPAMKAEIEKLHLETEDEIFEFLVKDERNKMTPLQLEAIEEYTSWNSNFLDSYKSYLENGEKSHKNEVNLDATLWHYKELFTKLNAKIIELDNTNRKLDELMAYMAIFTSNNARGKYRKLCKLQFYFQDQLLANDAVHKLQEWEQFESLPLIGTFTDEYCENVIYAENIAAQILYSIKIGTKNVNFDYLDWLLTNSIDFQQFFLKTNKNFKEKIVDILAMEAESSTSNKFELLDKMEKMHPKWMRIDEMHDGMRLNLYKKFLQTKSFQKESEEIERRISIALLIEGMKRAKNSSTKFGLALENAMLFKRLQAKIEELLGKIYEKSGDKFDCIENICLLAQFIPMLNMATIHSQEGGENIYYLQSMGGEEKILKYSGSLCQNKAIQDRSLGIQRSILQNEHIAFFNAKLAELGPLVDKFGGLTRISLLMPNLQFNESVRRRDFSNDSLLRQHLRNAIFAQSSGEEMANRMAVGFFAWTRHLDSKLEGWLNTEDEAQMKTDPKILHEVWKSTIVRKNLIQKCDGLGDTSWLGLIQTEMLLSQLCFDILALIDKAKEKKVFSKDELENIIVVFLMQWEYDQNNERWKDNEITSKLVEYHELVQKLVGEELLEQLNTELPDLEEMVERAKFADELRKHFGKNIEDRTILSNLLGVEGNMIERVLEKLNIKIGQPAEEEMEEQMKEWEAETKKLSEEYYSSREKESEEEIQQKILLNESSKLEAEKHFVAAEDSAAAEIRKIEGGEFLEKNIEKSSKSPEESSSKGKNIEEEGKEGHFEKKEIEEKLEKEEIKNKKDKTKKQIEAEKAIENIEKMEQKKKDEEKRREIEAKRRERKEKEKENKRARKQRKMAQRKEMFRKKAIEKAKILESTAKEQKRQINEQLIVQGLVNLLKERGYGEFPDPIKNANENEAKRMANRKKYLNQSEFAILNVMEMLVKWNKESRFLISGSNQLQLNSNISDIDLIVIIPYDPSNLSTNWAMEFEENFIGNSKVKCKIVERKCGENEEENSLYCFLCKEKKINSIKKIVSHIPLIKMNYKRAINFDINMALVPKGALPGRHFPTIQRQLNLIKGKKLSEKMEIIQTRQPGFEQIDEMIRKIIAAVGREIMEAKGKTEEMEAHGINLRPQIDAGVHRFLQSRAIIDKRNQDGREGMVLVLSGYRANKQMAKLLDEPNKEEAERYRNFQIATLALKFWAKNHFIYNGIFGFLNGATLAAMVCKLAMESHENASALTLLEQFFRTYHKNGNEMLEPVELAFDKNDAEIRNSLDWSMEKENVARNRNALGWQVITAGFPTQNAAFTILPSTGRIINAEMGKALEKVGKAQKLVEMPREVEANEIKEFLEEFLLSDKKFEENFDNFVAIVCKYSPQSVNGLEFCDFFELKIRLKLLDIDEPQIEHCHVKPERIVDAKRCPQRFRNAPTQNDKDLCVIWVAGIKLKNGTNSDEAIKVEAAINWKEPLKQKIAKVKDDFFGQLPKDENSSWAEEKKQMEATFRFIPNRKDLLDAVKIESNKSEKKKN